MLTSFPTKAIRRAVCCALLSLAALPALAQTKPAEKTPVASEPTITTATYGNWVLRCVQLEAKAGAQAAARSCEAVHTVQVQGQQQPIAQIAIGRLPDSKALLVTAVVPVNVSLPGSIHVSGNAKTGGEEKGGINLAWQKCLTGMCAASAKLGPQTLAILRAETDGQLRFTDATGNTIAIPLSWAGLDQALKALDKAL